MTSLIHPRFRRTEGLQEDRGGVAAASGAPYGSKKIVGSPNLLDGRRDVDESDHQYAAEQFDEWESQAARAFADALKVK